MKINKLLMLITGTFVISLANADDFPLGAADAVNTNTANANNGSVQSQQIDNNKNGQLSQNSNISNSISTSASVNTGNASVPNLSTPIQNSQNNVNNNNINSPSVFSSADKETADLNSIKRQKAITEEQNRLNNSPQQSLSTSSIPSIIGNASNEIANKPTTAVMTSYLIYNNKKTATIRFGDGSIADVSVGDKIAGYKVSNINEDYTLLNKYDKSKIGKNSIKVYKVNFIPASNQNSGVNFATTAPSFDMSGDNKQGI